MHRSLRVLAALLTTALATASLFAQSVSPSSERDKVGYMIGLDVGRSLAPGLPDADLAALQRSVENGLVGGAPLLSKEDADNTAKALMASISARKAGKPAPNVDRAAVGLLLGSDVGHKLASIRTEFDVPMFMRGLRDGANSNTPPALDDAEIHRVRSAFSARVSATLATQQAKQADAAHEDEIAFFAKNKQVKGVYTTPSGLQYMVLQQGSGVRPRPGQSVLVNYVGTLLDGSKFDSSYDRGEPAEFQLDRLIAGWTEGIGMMPVGGKYRFWIPAALGYGERGSGKKIPPNSTLVFDVELLGVK